MADGLTKGRTAWLAGLDNRSASRFEARFKRGDLGGFSAAFAAFKTDKKSGHLPSYQVAMNSAKSSSEGLTAVRT